MLMVGRMPWDITAAGAENPCTIDRGVTW